MRRAKARRTRAAAAASAAQAGRAAGGGGVPPPPSPEPPRRIVRKVVTWHPSRKQLATKAARRTSGAATGAAAEGGDPSDDDSSESEADDSSDVSQRQQRAVRKVVSWHPPDFTPSTQWPQHDISGQWYESEESEDDTNVSDSLSPHHSDTNDSDSLSGKALAKKAQGLTPESTTKQILEWLAEYISHREDSYGEDSPHGWRNQLWRAAPDRAPGCPHKFAPCNDFTWWHAAILSPASHAAVGKYAEAWRKRSGREMCGADVLAMKRAALSKLVTAALGADAQATEVPRRLKADSGLYIPGLDHADMKKHCVINCQQDAATFKPVVKYIVTDLEAIWKARHAELDTENRVRIAIEESLNQRARGVPTATALAAERVFHLDPIRSLIFSHIRWIRDMCRLRRVNRAMRTFVDESLPMSVKMMLRGFSPGSGRDKVRRSLLGVKERHAWSWNFHKKRSKELADKEKAVSTAAIDEQLARRFGPLAPTIPRGRMWDVHVEKVTKESQGKPYCKLKRQVQYACVMQRVAELEPEFVDIVLSKEAICCVSRTLFTSCVPAWSSANKFGTLRNITRGKHKGWKAGPIWQAWQAARVIPAMAPSCGCVPCRLFDALRRPPCVHGTSGEAAPTKRQLMRLVREASSAQERLELSGFREDSLIGWSLERDLRLSFDYRRRTSRADRVDESNPKRQQAVSCGCCVAASSQSWPDCVASRPDLVPVCCCHR